MKLDKLHREFLGEMLREYREKRGLSQTEAAESVGYTSPQFMSNIERGVCATPLPTLKALAELYKIPKRELITTLSGFYSDAIERGLK